MRTARATASSSSASAPITRCSRPTTPSASRLLTERLTHWIANGAQPTDRVAKFLGKAGLITPPVYAEQPKQSAPKKKAQERAAERAKAAA